MKKSTKNIFIISGVLLGLMVLYLAGAVILYYMGMQYRSWVSGLGKCLCIQVFPLWIAGVVVWILWQRFREHKVGKWLVRLFGVLTVLFCLLWSFIGFFIIVFTTYEDEYLGSGLVAVVIESFPKPADYDIYESVGPFFRRKTSLTPEKVAEYLMDRYKREFYPVEENGKTLYVDAERETVRITVDFLSGKLSEDYPQALADYYLEEGYRAAGMDWDFCTLEMNQWSKGFCLILDEEKNFNRFGADIYRLTQYALAQDSLLEKYDVSVFFSWAEYEDHWNRVGFGSYRSWEDSSLKDYGDDEAKVIQLVTQRLDRIRQETERDRKNAQEAAQGSQFPQDSDTGAHDAVPTASSEPTPEPTMREMVEGEYPEQCKAAEAIWEAELKDSGYDYEPGANAKGNLVIWLGKLPSDNLQSSTEESDYYLTYDRESKNGNCYLFVLSEVPEGHGLNDAYLREFYACEKDTFKVVAGNKTSWAQVGSAEYRELTGE